MLPTHDLAKRVPLAILSAFPACDAVEPNMQWNVNMLLHLAYGILGASKIRYRYRVNGLHETRLQWPLTQVILLHG